MNSRPLSSSQTAENYERLFPEGISAERRHTKTNSSLISLRPPHFASSLPNATFVTLIRGVGGSTAPHFIIITFHYERNVLRPLNMHPHPSCALRLTPVRGWIASTYQRDTDPRDYQECSQVESSGNADSSGLLTKVRITSGLSIRAYHTALFGAPEPETQFETPNPFLPVLRSLEHPVFIDPFREWSSAYLFLHWIMVLSLTNSSPS
ncbi:hypothetical protein AVEN_106412-1 [Araneus ventricosus]|uniref:Uncharacterized protein n=1 Tax=Araneus ventricosus TaxID=182803 RepID=A0A4Y2AT41_ARAVE|nr:hypothetical protein AVEN_106412-1 [Araneus ventricosus]